MLVLADLEVAVHIADGAEAAKAIEDLQAAMDLLVVEAAKPLHD